MIEYKDWSSRKTLLCPSVLSADLSDLTNSIDRLGDGYDMLHCDIMDGSFVPTITFGAQMVSQIKKKTDKPLDVHLMVARPEEQILPFVEAGATTLVFHREASLHPQLLLAKIRSMGCLAGISLSPATPLETLKYLLPDLDLILLMTVNPGYGGQSYLPQMTDKVRSAREMIDASPYHIRLEVDGGISRNNLAEQIYAGADMIVSGSAIFSVENPAEEVKSFQDKIDELDRELKRIL